MPIRPAPLRLLLGTVALVATGCKPGLIAGNDAGIASIPDCTADTSVDCSGGGAGFTCPAGVNPERGESVSCTTPVIAPDGSDQYCCFLWSHGFSTCTPDDELTAACLSGSYGYQCADPTDDPTSLDSALQCSTPKPDFDGRDTDFCCSH